MFIRRRQFARRQHAQRLRVDAVFLDQDAGGEGLGGVAGQDGHLRGEDGRAFVEAGGDEMDGAAMDGGAGGQRLLVGVRGP